MAKANPKNQPKKPDTAANAVLRITAKQPGFRRAGYAFGQEAVDIAVADLSDEQYGHLTTEPMLVCVEAEVEAPAAE